MLHLKKVISKGDSCNNKNLHIRTKKIKFMIKAKRNHLYSVYQKKGNRTLMCSRAFRLLAFDCRRYKNI